MILESLPGVAVVGGGPAGLMAAEVARAAGASVDLYEAKGSVGRKFLIAGKGGLNLTHSEPLDDFARRYRERAEAVRRWLEPFDAGALRAWSRELGVETFVGSSGRVFPSDMKAAPLLRAWVRRLRESGVRFHVQHRCTGFGADGSLRFQAPGGPVGVHARSIVLALGGASWPQLGSDGLWMDWIGRDGIGLAPLHPANCGFDVDWSEHFSGRFAGHPVKPVRVSLLEPEGAGEPRQGELVITATGIEGSLVYALSARLREAMAARGTVTIELDLAPGRDEGRLLGELSRPRNGRSTSDFLRRAAGLGPVQVGLVHEHLSKGSMSDAASLVRAIKHLPLQLTRARPVAESISTAGGVTLESLLPGLMLEARPGVFCAGEMLDWEAPTGGYLLAASLASGRIAGASAAAWLNRQ